MYIPLASSFVRPEVEVFSACAELLFIDWIENCLNTEGEKINKT